MRVCVGGGGGGRIWFTDLIILREPTVQGVREITSYHRDEHAIIYHNMRTQLVHHTQYTIASKRLWLGRRGMINAKLVYCSLPCEQMYQRLRCWEKSMGFTFFILEQGRRQEQRVLLENARLKEK